MDLRGRPDLAPAFPSGLRLAIGAVVKNEAAYLLEWIAFHRVLGVDRLFIADNDSTDGSSEMLAALNAAGVVRHIPFPNRSGAPPQLPAYGEILRRHGGEADWIAFIDADEFLMPSPGAGALRSLIERLGALDTCGAIVVNWAVYGSSGRDRPGEGLVIERFTARAAREWFCNHHVKSIVRPHAVRAVGRTPHAFALHQGFRALHADGRPLVGHPAQGEGVSAAVVWEALRLNHYVVKSREEFLTHKLPRGRATVQAYRERSFFEAHDRNEVADPAPSGLVQATRLEQARLAQLIADAFGPLPGGAEARSDAAV